MKLSNVFAKLTSMKSNAFRVLAAATLAGAAFAATPAAQAQHFAVGVQLGGPRYYAPVPPPRVAFGYGRVAPVYGYGYGPGFYDHRRFEEREASIRHQEWDRSHYGRPYGYR